MNLRPVIRRELVAASRHTSLYGLRAAAALVLMLVFGSWYQALPPELRLHGATLFRRLELAAFLGLWIAVPLLVSDTISREKREGTFPLLFLTPLAAWEIVVAKMAAHVLRCGTLLLAAAPVFMLPILMGGITWQEVARAGLYCSSALLLGLATGFLASALSRKRSWAAAVALSLSLASCVTFSLLHGVVMTRAYIPAGSRGQVWKGLAQELRYHWQVYSGTIMELLPSQDPRRWRWTVAGRGRISNHDVLLGAGMFTGAVVATGIVVAAAGLVVRQASRDHPSSGDARRSWSPGTTTEARALSVRGCSLAGRRNLTRWVSEIGWAVVVFAIYLWLRSQGRSIIPHEYISWAGVILTVGVAWRSAGLFQDDRETGFLELWLVTPSNRWSMLWQRIIPLALEFAPAMGLLLVLGGTLAFGIGQPPGLPLGLDREVMQTFLYQCGAFLLFYLSAVSAIAIWIGLRTIRAGWLLACAAAWLLWRCCESIRIAIYRTLGLSQDGSLVVDGRSWAVLWAVLVLLCLVAALALVGARRQLNRVQ